MASPALKHKRDSWAVPYALQSYAASFLAAANDVKARAEFDPAKAFLVCHALELALKAFLSLKGQRYEELATRKEFRHRLDSLLAAAQKQNLSGLVKLKQSQLSEIKRVACDYEETVFGYPPTDLLLELRSRIPDIAVLTEAAEALVKALKEPCLSVPQPALEPPIVHHAPGEPAAPIHRVAAGRSG